MLKPVDESVDWTPGDDVELLGPNELARIGRLPLVVRVVNTLLTDAIKADASEIHVEPQGGELLVRFRINGHLVDAIRLPQHLRAPTISRLKIIGRLEIAVHETAQHGRVRLRWDANRVDLHIATIPSEFGEAVHIRLATDSAAQPAPDQLEMTPRTLAAFQRLLRSPQGLLIIAGPSDGGRTSTLQAALDYLAASARKIVTVGCAVEDGQAGVTHVHAGSTADVTFAVGLRTALRQDCEVVLLGEMPDQETAHAAVEAAQGGRLVVTTLQSTDAAAAIADLLDIGIEPYQVSLSVVGILAHRLVRQVCPACAVDRPPTLDLIEQVGLAADAVSAGRWRAGAGCAQCLGTGLNGRTAIHELLEMNEEIRSLVSAHAPDHLIRGTASRYGMVSMFDDAVAKASAGLATLEEVCRVVARLDGTVDRQPSSNTRATGGTAALPMSPEPAADADARKSILILEDDPDTQALLQLILDKAGYRTVVAGDGIEALLELGRTRFDLMLSDINMPNLDGLTLIEMKSQKGIKTPVVFLTADSGAEQQCLELGAVDYIQKPIRRDVLLLRIQRALK